MKLIFCPHCEDVVKIKRVKTFCSCKKCWGWYKKDGLHVIINKDAIPLGFSNPTLAEALYLRPAAGLGSRFEAFVIPIECPTIEVEK